MTQNIEKTNKRKTLLIILDGFGLADESDAGNAITSKTAPHLFRFMKQYPSAKLLAHGKAVGLPKAQEGNSEAGHLTIGAGRYVEQDITAVSSAIENGTFFKNSALLQAMAHAKEKKRTLHIMGLLTDGKSAHASPEHVYALLDMAEREGVKRVALHLFTDGRDSSPHSAITHLHALKKHLKPGQRIATLMGRFYAMDRNKVWKRTEQAYNTLVLGTDAMEAASAESAIESAYNRGETDEYIAPTVIEKHPIKNGDSVIFFNARSDRARQLAKAFVQKEFTELNKKSFTRKRVLKDLTFVAMSEFGPDLDGILTAFPSPDMNSCLAKAIGEAYRQLFISETEKYAHVTYFLNGGYPKPINGEDRELIASGTIKNYATHPEMKTHSIAQKICQYIQLDHYDFVCVNFPNADMVGHTGDLQAAKRAVTTLDREVANLVQCMRGVGGITMITADHGNAEMMIHPKTGEVMTAHTTNPVPCIIIDDKRKGSAMKDGTLQDVAPTLLKLMGLKKPKEMTGKALI